MFITKNIHCYSCYNKIHINVVYFLTVLVVVWAVFLSTSILSVNKNAFSSNNSNISYSLNDHSFTAITNNSVYKTSSDTISNNLLCVFNMINKNKKITEKQRDEIILAAMNAEKVTGIDAALLLVLANKESKFDLGAKSKKGYLSIMQTPVASKRWYSVDMLIGAEILKEKIALSKGDIKKAVAMYKGGANKPVSVMLASKVLSDYKTCKKECYEDSQNNKKV